MFPHHLLLALCVVGIACIACCGEASYAQTPATAQAVTPNPLTAVELVAKLATADDSARDQILEQLKVVDLKSLSPMVRLTSPSLILDPLTRWRAASVLHDRYTVGDAELQQLIRNSSMQNRLNYCAQEVCRYWQAQGPDGLATLLAAVESPNSPLSQQALLALRSGRELPPEAFDRLQKQLPQHPHAMDLALLLGQHGRVPAEAVPGLIAGLKMGKTMGCTYCASATPRVESDNAGAALAKLDSAAATAAAPQLIAALSSPNGTVRSAVIQAMRKIDAPQAVSAISHLIEALKVEDRSVRAAAADMLGKIGPAAKEAIPALIVARDYKSKYVVPVNKPTYFSPSPPESFEIPYEATRALLRIQPPEPTDNKRTSTETSPAETPPEELTKALPGIWKIELAIAPKLLQRPIQEIREYLYLIVALQGGFQSQPCQVKLRADGLALLQVPNISNPETMPERHELAVNWKVSKNKAGKTTLTVSHPGVGDLIFHGSVRQLDTDTVECEIMAPLPGEKPDEPSLPIFIVKLQRVKR